MSKAKITKPKVIQDSQEDSDSSVPIVAPKANKKQQVEVKKVAKKPVQPESSEEEDTPVVEKKPTKQVKAQVPVAKKVVQVSKKPVKPQSSEQEESEEQQPKKVVAKVKSPVQKPVAKKPKVQSSEQESSEEPVVKAKPAAKVVAKVTSPVQKPVAKKPVKKVESSEEESEQQAKPVFKAKSPVVKAKSPVLKAKSPVQKPQATKKKVSSSEEESEQKPKPTKKGAKKVESSEEEEQPVAKKPAQKAGKKVEQTKMVDQDQEGQFEVCVRGLSFQAYDSDIREFFNACGNVSFVKLLLRDDGKSKGTGFVKFSKKSSFNAALELNGSQHLGRSLTIEESQGKKTAPAGSFGGNAGGNNRSYGQEGNANIETPTLFIGGLSYNSTVESITDFFSQHGEIASARIVTDKQTGRPRGFGYVEFHDVDSAKKAYKELNGGNLDGRNIRLDSASQRDRPAGGDRGGFGGGRGGSFGGSRGGSFGGSRGGFGGDRGGFGGRGAPRNPGNSTVDLSQDDKNAKKGSIGTFAGKKMTF